MVIQSARLGEGIDDGSRCYAVFNWAIPSANPASARTETADKGRAPQWEHRALLGFERGKHATETFFARRRVDVQLWAEAGGFGKFFGGEDALLAQADFKLSELVSNDRWGCELPMRDPATDDRTPVAYIKLAFRLRWPIDYTPPKEERPSRGGRASAGSAGGGGGGGGGAVKPLVDPLEADDMAFANAIVSVNVLDAELLGLAEKRAALEAKGKLVPLSFGDRAQALQFRKEMIELQVETGQLTAPAYVAQLRQAAARERAKALEYKGKPGGTAVAVAALKRLKVMQEEIDGAVKGGIA